MSEQAQLSLFDGLAREVQAVSKRHTPKACLSHDLTDSLLPGKLVCRKCRAVFAQPSVARSHVVVEVQEEG